jgi:hypothetical protein
MRASVNYYREDGFAAEPFGQPGIIFVVLRLELKHNYYTTMLYSETRYPEKMKNLPEDVRRKAIKITNDMLVDGDVRYHKDFIILKAILEAKQWAKQKSDQNLN